MAALAFLLFVMSSFILQAQTSPTDIHVHLYGISFNERSGNSSFNRGSGKSMGGFEGAWMDELNDADKQSLANECGHSISCYYDCQNKEVCQKATDCEWLQSFENGHMWEGCVEKLPWLNKNDCGLGKFCTDRECDNREECEKAPDYCVWDKFHVWGKGGCKEKRDYTNTAYCGHRSMPCSHRECNNREMCQEAKHHCVWNQRDGCIDKSPGLHEECGVSKACNHLDCDYKEVCQRAMNCNWDIWDGCIDKDSPKVCGATKACTDEYCNNEDVCQQAINCKWDKRDGCTYKWSKTECGQSIPCNDKQCQDRQRCKNSLLCAWGTKNFEPFCKGKNAIRECGLKMPCSDKACNHKLTCGESWHCDWDWKKEGCVDSRISRVHCGVNTPCDDTDCGFEYVCRRAGKCKWDKHKGCTEKKSACIKKDLLYDGFDLDDYVPVMGLERCACECRAEERCNFFTWNKHDRRCAMKSSKGKIKQHSGSYSGSVNCCIMPSDNGIIPGK